MDGINYSLCGSKLIHFFFNILRRHPNKTSLNFILEIEKAGKKSVSLIFTIRWKMDKLQMNEGFFPLTYQRNYFAGKPHNSGSSERQTHARETQDPHIYSPGIPTATCKFTNKPIYKPVIRPHWKNINTFQKPSVNSCVNLKPLRATGGSYLFAGVSSINPSGIGKT